MKNSIVDSHCHLDFDVFKNDLNSVIKRARLNKERNKIKRALGKESGQRSKKNRAKTRSRQRDIFAIFF